MFSEPFKNRVWRCIGASAAGSAIGSTVLTDGFLVVQFPQDGTLDVVGPGSFEALSFIAFALAVGSLLYTIPSAILVLLPIARRLRGDFARSPVQTAAAAMTLAAMGGAAVVLAVGIVGTLRTTSGPNWQGLLEAVAMTLPFSMSAALVLAWRTRRALCA